MPGFQWFRPPQRGVAAEPGEKRSSTVAEAVARRSDRAGGLGCQPRESFALDRCSRPGRPPAPPAAPGRPLVAEVAGTRYTNVRSAIAARAQLSAAKSTPGSRTVPSSAPRRESPRSETIISFTTRSIGCTVRPRGTRPPPPPGRRRPTPRRSRRRVRAEPEIVAHASGAARLGEEIALVGEVIGIFSAQSRSRGDR